MKQEILNRYTGEVLFIAEIDCEENAPTSERIGLAARWRLVNGANLFEANLRGADLFEADLCGANLFGAKLSGANLFGANLFGADLSEANLREANLFGAKLREAKLFGAKLREAKLCGANLFGADLSEANLREANLLGANLSGADLLGANLSGANLSRVVVSLNPYIKALCVDVYEIRYTSECIQIGCENHAIEEWRKFDDARIVAMDGKKGLRFWRKYKDWLFQTIDLAPAEPTGWGEQ